MDGRGENEQRKKNFERKRKRYKLCREEMDVREVLKTVGMLLTAENKGFVRIGSHIFLDSTKLNTVWIKITTFFQTTRFNHTMIFFKLID